MPRDGIVEIIDGDSNVLGYLGDVTTQFGQYGYCPEREKAMKVHANCDGDRFNLMTVVSSKTFLQLRRKDLNHDV